MIKYCKDILVYKTSGKLEIYNEDEKSQIKEIAQKVDKQQLIDMIYELSEMENEIKRTTQKTIMFQAGMIKLCNQKDKKSTDIDGSQNNGGNLNLERRVEKIENYLKNNRVNF